MNTPRAGARGGGGASFPSGLSGSRGDSPVHRPFRGDAAELVKLLPEVGQCRLKEIVNRIPLLHLDVTTVTGAVPVRVPAR
jgi:hypothetical protein